MMKRHLQGFIGALKGLLYEAPLAPGRHFDSDDGEFVLFAEEIVNPASHFFVLHRRDEPSLLDGVAVGKTLIGPQRFTAGKMSILSQSGIVKPVCLRRRRLEEWQRAAANGLFSAVIPNQDKRLRGWRCWWGEQMAGVSLGR